MGSRRLSSGAGAANAASAGVAIPSCGCVGTKGGEGGDGERSADKDMSAASGARGGGPGSADRDASAAGGGGGGAALPRCRTPPAQQRRRTPPNQSRPSRVEVSPRTTSKQAAAGRVDCNGGEGCGGGCTGSATGERETSRAAPRATGGDCWKTADPLFRAFRSVSGLLQPLQQSGPVHGAERPGGLTATPDTAKKTGGSRLPRAPLTSWHAVVKFG